MANAYYSKQWDGLSDGTVVAVKDGVAVIGTDAFSTYSAAKAAGDVVLCDVFASAEWAGTVSSTVTVEIEGDNYDLTVGEQAFATLDAAAMQVATNQYGGVETYGDNSGVANSFVYVSGAWGELPDYTVVVTGSTVWNEEGTQVAGGTAVIGVTAFATYTDANNKADLYFAESELNSTAASSDIYLDSTWLATQGREIGDKVTVTLPDGTEVAAFLGQNGVLFADDKAATMRTKIQDISPIARQNNQALYFTGGTFLQEDATSNGGYFTWGAKTVVANSFVQRISAGTPYKVDYTLSPELYLFEGARTNAVYVAGYAGCEKAYVYIAKDAYASSVISAQSNGERSVGIIEVDVDGGTVGTVQGNNQKITEEMNFTLRNHAVGTRSRVGVDSGDDFSRLSCDVNFSIIDSTLSDGITISHRDWGRDGWAYTYNVAIQDMTVTIDNSYVKSISNGTSAWSFKSYTIILDGGSVQTLTPRVNSGDYYANYCNVVGGTATIMGGTFRATASGAGKGDNTETDWIDADVRFLTTTSTVVTYNNDGTITVKNGIFYNANGAANQKWIVGGTATFVGGTHNLVTLSVVGDETSTVDTMYGIEAITIDATAQLALKCAVESSTVITVNATDVASLVGKAVITTTSTINSSKVTLLENGVVSSDYYLKNTGNTLVITAKPVYYSALWADLADGETVVVNGETLTIGIGAFNDYSQAVATTKPVQDLDTYAHANPVWVAGETVTLDVNGGSYATVVAGKASGTANAYTTSELARIAHVSYYPAGAIVLDGNTVTGRTWLNSTQANPYILKNYVSTGGGDQGFCISAVSTANREGGYAIVDAGSKLNTVYMGERNGGGTMGGVFGTLTLKVVNGGSISALYAGGLYESKVGSSTDYATVDITVNGGTVNGIYGSGCSNGDMYANVTVNAINTRGSFVYGGGNDVGSTNHGTFTLNLTNSVYSGDVRYYTPSKNSTKGTFTVNAVAGTSTVGGVIDLRATDAITIDANALLLAGTVTGVVAITVDATNFDLGAAEKKLVFTQTASDITANFAITGDQGKYVLVREGRNVYVTTRSVVYSALWGAMTPGEGVVVAGSTYTIGYDAFGNYADAKTAAETLERRVTVCDAFYSPAWSSKSAGDLVDVVIDGEVATLKIGENAYKTFDGAVSAAGTERATVLSGTYSLGNADRRNIFAVNGQTTIFRGAVVASCAWNAGFYTGTYDGTLKVTEKSSLAVINGYSCAMRTDKTVTIIVDDSTVSALYAGAYTSTDTWSVNATTGHIDWAGTGGRAITNIKVVNGASVSDIYYGSYASGAVLGDINVEIADSRVTTLFVTSSEMNGNLCASLNSGTVTTVTGGNNSGSRYIDLAFTGGTSYIAQFGDMSHVTGMNLTINAGDRAAVVIGSSYQMYSGATITVNVDNFQWQDGEKSFTVLSTNEYLAGKTVSVTGTALDEFDLVKTGSSIKLERKKSFFSIGWADLPDGTIVNVPGTTATIGENAFASYDAAKAKYEEVVCCDTYYNMAWKDLSVGDDILVEIPGNTFTAKIDNVNFCTSFATAQNRFTDYSGSAVIIAAGTTTGSRTTYTQLNGKNTVIYNYQMYSNKPQLDESPVIIVLDESGAATVKTGSVTLGVNNKLTTVYGNRSGTTAKDIHFDVTVQEGTYVEYYIAANWGGDVGSSDTYTVDATTGKLLWSGEADHSTVFVNVEGGSINSIAPTIYSSGSKGGYTGDMTVNVSGGVINQISGKVSGSPNVNFYINLAGGTVKSIAPGTGNGNRYFEIAVTDDAQVGTFGAGHYAMTIDYDATLTVTGSNFANVGTITIDAANCDYSQAQYLIVNSAAAVANEFVLVNDDPTKNYTIVKVGNNVFYQAPTTYFSVTWADLASGTTVYVDSKPYTIGTDAFASYDAAVEAGAKLINSADTYLNNNYNATDPIMIGNYQAKYGVDAFSNFDSAIATAKTMGGALDVTGWNAGLVGLDGIENVFIDNAKIGSGASITVQSGTTTAAKLNVRVSNSDANYVNIVNNGSVTGDVNVTLDNVTTYNATYIVAGGKSVGGNVELTVDGGSYITKGIYTLDDNATVTKNVAITLGDCEIYRKGVQINGTVNGTATVTVTGNAIVSAITESFNKVTIASDATLHYGKGLDGDWKASYLKGFTDLENNGTLYYDADLGQNAYAMLYKNLSGTGTIELGDNVTFTNGGTTYVAEMQANVLVNSAWAGKEMFDVVEVDGGTTIFGVSAFADKTAAQASGLTNDATTFVVYGQEIVGPTYGDDGHLGFAGGTVTGTAYAGKIESATTVETDSAVAILGVSTDPGSFGSVVGGYEISADTTVNANSTLTVTGTDNVTGKALVGSSYISGAAVTFDGTSTVTVESGSFSNALIGGALVNGSGSITGTLNTDVTLSGGTVKVLGGGCYLQGGGSVSVGGESNLTISNATVVGSVFGGNFANKLDYATSDLSTWNGDTNITINATESVVIGGNVVAGSYGKGSVSGNTELTFTGSGDKLKIAGHITGDSSNGDDSSTGKCVTGTRTLVFDSFSGDLGTETKKVTGFDAVELNNSTVTLAGYGMLKSVSDWSITDSTLDWSKGANDFASDKLTLVSTNDIGTDGWTVFQLGSGLDTGWNGFMTDSSVTDNVSVKLTVGGTDYTLVGVKEEQTGPVVYYADANYKFYKDDNALKVAKLA